jgi:hypothetical protein
MVAVLANRGTVVQFGEDATIGEGEEADAVVALGGDAIVNGTVQAAVAVGGDVIVNGTVEKTCVAVGGDVRLRSTAVVGSELAKKSDAAVVLVGGNLIRSPQAQLNGNTTSVHGDWFTNAFRWGIWDPVVHPFRIGSVLGWFIQTIVLGVLAIIAVAIAPRQVRAVGEKLRRRSLASLGWGALTGIIILPVSIVLLTITIIGLLIVVPGVIIVLPLTALFSFLCLCVAVGGMVMAGSDRHRANLILAAVIGVAIVNVIRLVPFVGGFVVCLATLMAFGACVLAIGDWQRRRREARRLARAAGGPQPPAPGAPPAGPQPLVPGAPPAGPQPLVPGAPPAAPQPLVPGAPPAAPQPPAPGAAPVGELPVVAPPAGTVAALAPGPAAAEDSALAGAEATTQALRTAKLPVPDEAADAAAAATGEPPPPAPPVGAEAGAEAASLAGATTDADAEAAQEAPPAPAAEPAQAPPDESTGARP